MKDEKSIQDSQVKADGFLENDARELSDEELDAIAGGLSDELSDEEEKMLIDNGSSLLFMPIVLK